MQKKLNLFVVVSMFLTGSCLLAQDLGKNLLKEIPTTPLLVVLLDTRETNPSVQAVKTERSDKSNEIAKAWGLAIGQQLLIELSRDLDIRKDVTSWIEPVFAIAVLSSGGGKKKPEVMVLAKVLEESAAVKGVSRILDSAAQRKWLRNYGVEYEGVMLHHVVGKDETMDYCYTIARGYLVATRTLDALKTWVKAKGESASFLDTVGGKSLVAEPDALMSFYVNVSGDATAQLSGLVENNLSAVSRLPMIPPGLSPSLQGKASKKETGFPALKEDPSKKSLGVPVESVVGSLVYLKTGARMDLRVCFKAGVNKKVDEVLRTLAEGRSPDPLIAKAAPASTLAGLFFSNPSQTMKVAGLDPSGLGMWIELLGLPVAEGESPKVPDSVSKLLSGDLALYLTSFHRKPDVKRPATFADLSPVDYLPLVVAFLASDEDLAVAASKDLCDWLGQLLKVDIKDVESSAGKIKSISLTASKEKKTYGYLASSGRFLLLSNRKEELETALARINGQGASLMDSSAFKNVRAEMKGKMPLQVYSDAVQLMASGVETALDEATRANPYARKAIEMTGEGLKASGLGFEVEKDRVHSSLFLGMDYKALEDAQNIYMAMMIPGILGSVALPAFMKSKDQAHSVECMTNLKQLAMAARMYAEDHHEKMPDVNHWTEALRPYLKDDHCFRCPGDSRKIPCSYAMSVYLSNRTMKSVKDPSHAILFFDAQGMSKNPFGTESIMMPRHRGGVNIAYLDGHVQTISVFPTHKAPSARSSSGSRVPR